MPMSFCAPNYDASLEPIVYDTSYNIALRKRLEDDYYKKCFIKTAQGSECICGANSYYKMVQVPYDLNKIDSYGLAVEKLNNK